MEYTKFYYHSNGVSSLYHCGYEQCEKSHKNEFYIWSNATNKYEKVTEQEWNEYFT